MILADLPVFFIMLLSGGSHILFLVWLFALIPPHAGEYLGARLLGAPAVSMLLAYLSKRAIEASVTMDSDLELILNKWNTAALYIMGAFFVLLLIVAIIATVKLIIESRQPPKDPWDFYIDGQGRHCVRGRFLYRWHKGKDRQEQLCTRSFDGTIEEFLAFNKKWQPCEEQEGYQLAATEKLKAIRATSSQVPAQDGVAHTNG